MRLKRMWPGVCILVMFFIFDVVMVAGSSFFSGLFPSDMALIYSGIFTLLGVLIMGVLTFLLGRICDHIDTSSLSDELICKIVYVFAVVAIIVSGIAYRVDVLGTTTLEPTGKLSLYENAVVGATQVSSEYDLLSIVYSGILHFVLLFTGNKILFAFLLEIALFTCFIIFGTLTARILLGKVASVSFAAIVSFMPMFIEGLYKVELGTDNLFLAMFGLELLILAIFLRNASEGNYDAWGYVVWYLKVGAAVGFMTYLDAGTIVAVLPLLLSSLFVFEDELKERIIRLLFVLLGAVVTFFAMIMQENGLFMTGVVLGKWVKYYFRNINIFSLFVVYTDHKIEYMVMLIIMSGVLVGYFRNRKFERVSPWLLSTLLVFLVTPFFGATRMNDQMVVTIYFAFVIACVFSLITLTRDAEPDYVPAHKPAKREALESEDENAEDERVVRPDNPVVLPVFRHVVDVPKEELAEEPAEEAQVAEEAALEEDSYDGYEEPVEEESSAVEEAPAQYESTHEDEYEEPSVEKAPAKEPEADKPHFVPEGMVLPTGSEDEMDVDLSRTRMRMPSFEGKISLNRPGQKKAEAPAIKKDDFDIEFTPGDDFDI